MDNMFFVMKIPETFEYLYLHDKDFNINSNRNFFYKD